MNDAQRAVYTTMDFRSKNTSFKQVGTPSFPDQGNPFCLSNYWFEYSEQLKDDLKEEDEYVFIEDEDGGLPFAVLKDRKS